MSSMKFNINRSVKVKLTDFGMDILKSQHEDLKRSFPKIGNFRPPNQDENGYCKFQLWDLMSRFGGSISLGGEVPFETDILLESEDENEPQ